MLRRPILVRRRPGLLGTIARTAVVAGTATATVGALQGRRDRKAQAAADQLAARQAVTEQQQQLNDMQQQVEEMQPVAAPAPAAAQPDLIAELQKLTTLHESGALTDAEFAAAKTQLLTT